MTSGMNFIPPENDPPFRKSDNSRFFLIYLIYGKVEDF